MPLAAGTRLGPYEILAPIGAGGMGGVYKALDKRLDRIVAVKVSQENFSERFEREGRAIGALNHSNIYRLYDVGPNYLVMEFVEGTPLKGPLPLDRALKYAAQICDALERFRAPLEHLAAHADPMVREHARWALEQLALASTSSGSLLGAIKAGR